MQRNAFTRVAMEPYETLTKEWSELYNSFPLGETIVLSHSEAELYITIATIFLADMLNRIGTTRQIVGMHKSLSRFAGVRVEGCDIAPGLSDDNYPNPDYQDQANALREQSRRLQNYLITLGDAIQEIGRRPLHEQTAQNIRAAFLRAVDYSQLRTSKYDLDVERDFGVDLAAS